MDSPRNDSGFPSNVWSWDPLHKKLFVGIMLEIALNVQKCTKLRFSNPTPIGKGVSGNSTKITLMESTWNVLNLT